MERWKGATEATGDLCSTTRAGRHSERRGARARAVQTPVGESLGRGAALAGAEYDREADHTGPRVARYSSARQTSAYRVGCAHLPQCAVRAFRSAFRDAAALLTKVAATAASLTFACLLYFLTLPAFAGSCSTRPRQLVEPTPTVNYGIHFDEPCPEVYKGYCFNGGECFTTISIDRRRMPVCVCLTGWKGRQCEDINDPEVYYSRMHTEFETAALSSLVTFVIVATCCASLGMYIYRRCAKYNTILRERASLSRTTAENCEFSPFSPKRPRGIAYRSPTTAQRFPSRESAEETPPIPHWPGLSSSSLESFATARSVRADSNPTARISGKESDHEQLTAVRVSDHL